MMKSFSAIWILILTLSSYAVYSQVAPSEWVDFEMERLDRNKKGMLVLSGWAAANLISGSIGWATAKGPDKYFFQMNTFWNVVNMGLGVAGYLSSVNADPSGMTHSEILKGYNSMQNIFIFNAGLDIAYMAAGLYLMERSKNAIKNNDLLKGYGSSLILQGGFLFAFDLIMFLAQKSHADLHLYPLISGEMTGFGMRIGF